MTIETINDLHAYLHDAMKLEHSTIPPYLCALYSIPHGTNEEAAAVIQSVAMEEMLHMVLVANLTNAVRGSFKLNTKKFVPDYPTLLPRVSPSFEVDLQKFSPKALDLFLRIESPQEEPHGEKVRPSTRQNVKNYRTIGEFYDAVQTGLNTLVEEYGHDAVFSGDERLQITSEHYYGGAGEIIQVRNLDDANRAIKEIVDQGEGKPGEIGEDGVRSNDSEYLHRSFSGDVEPAHYFRFKEIRDGRYYQKRDTVDTGPRGPAFPVDWDSAFNMQLNPAKSTKKYAKHPEIQEKLKDFNRCYMRLLDSLQAAFSGEPSRLTMAVGDMFDLKHRAVELMRIPNPLDDGRTMVGPSFEYTKER